MFVQFEGKKLTEVINSEHENRKYLPGVKLEDNVVAIPDLKEAVKDATALIFVTPHQCQYSSYIRMNLVFAADECCSPRKGFRHFGG